MDKILRNYMENTQMSNEYLKKCSTSLAIRELKIKTTMKFYHSPTGMAKVKRSTAPNICEDVEQLNSHTLLMGV